MVREHFITSAGLGPALLTSSLLALLISAGCTERPSDRVENAKRLVSEARAGQASVYAIEDVERLETLLSSLQSTVDEQDESPRLIRDYGRVDFLADVITREAEHVMTASALERDLAQEQALAALEEAEAVLTDTRRRLQEIERQFGPLRLRRHVYDSNALDASLVIAKQAIEQEDYLAAEARARAIAAQVRSLAHQVDTQVDSMAMGQEGGANRNPIGQESHGTR